MHEHCSFIMEYRMVFGCTLSNVLCMCWEISVPCFVVHVSQGYKLVYVEWGESFLAIDITYRGLVLQVVSQYATNYILR